MFLCYNCQIIEPSNPQNIFCFSDCNNNTLSICNDCYNHINTKLIIQVDISKISAIKLKAKQKYLNKMKRLHI